MAMRNTLTPCELVHEQSFSSRPDVVIAKATTSLSIDMPRASSNLNVSTEQPIKEEPKSKEVKKKSKKKPDTEAMRRFKKVARFLVQNLGMICLTILYCCGGAYLFGILEGQTFVQTCQSAQSNSIQLIQSYTLEIYNYLSYNVTFDPVLATVANATLLDGPDVYNQVIYDYLVKLENEFYSNTYYGQDCQATNKWTFISALLWAITVVTSIGYGHVFPTTWEGQLVMICYALLGMPIFLLTLAKISGILADMFVFLYKNVFCCPFNMYTAYTQLVKERKLKEGSELDEEQGFESADPYRKKLTVSKMSVSNQNIKEELNENENDLNEQVVDAEEEIIEEQSSKVPFVIIVGTLVGFIIGSGYIFVYLEDWEPIVACYFVFISISSIGFGDWTEGMAALSIGEAEKATKNILIGSILTVIGMSILGMCLSLMAEGIIENITLGLKLIGVIKEDDEEDEEKDNQKADEKNDSVDNDEDDDDNDNDIEEFELKKRKNQVRDDFDSDLIINSKVQIVEEANSNRSFIK